MEAWRAVLKGDPLPWLLENETPAVRHLALRRILDEPPDSPAVRRAQAAAMRSDPIAAILAAQDEDGFFEPRHPWPKYRRTWAPFDTTHSTSKWVTLRACTVLRAVLG